MLHEVEQFEGSLAMEEEIFVHDEERMNLHAFFHARHDVEQLPSGFVKIDEVALAAEHRRSGTEVAAHGTSHRGNQHRSRILRPVRELHTHGPSAKARVDLRMHDRFGIVLTQKSAEPGYAVPADDVVRIDTLFNTGEIGNMAAHDYRAARLILPDERTHFADLADIGNNRGDADDIVFVGFEFPV